VLDHALLQGVADVLGLFQALQGDHLQLGARAEVAAVVGADLALAGAEGGGADVVLRADRSREDAVILVEMVGAIGEMPLHPEEPARQRPLPGAGGLHRVGGLDDLGVGVADQLAGRGGKHAAARAGVVVLLAEQQQRALDAELAVAPGAIDPKARPAMPVAEAVEAGVGGQLGHRGCAAHDVGQHRAALHVDPRSPAADDLDAQHAGGRDALQDVGQGVDLGGGPPPVDQHIARRAGETAHGVALLEGEARRQQDHVVGVVRRAAGEEGRVVGDHAGPVRRRRRRLGLRLGLRLGRQPSGEQQDGGGGPQAAGAVFGVRHGRGPRERCAGG